MSAMAFVICTSAEEGAGSPEGWLWTRMMAVALSSSERLDHLARDRPACVVDGAGLLHLVGDQPVLLVEKKDAELLDILERHLHPAIIEQRRP